MQWVVTKHANKYQNYVRTMKKKSLFVEVLWGREPIRVRNGNVKYNRTVYVICRPAIRGKSVIIYYGNGEPEQKDGKGILWIEE